MECHLTNQVNSSTQQVLQQVIELLNVFEQRIADSEFKIEKSKEIGQRIEDVLNRQLMDGLISYVDFLNLRHVKELWISTSAALSSYNLGCHIHKRKILTNLLDLFILKEISREVYVDFVIQL